MKLEKKVIAPRRIELVFYCEEPKLDYIHFLRWLSHFPHDNRTWIGTQHTIPNGNPAEPVAGMDGFDTFLFLPTLVDADRAISERLIPDGEAVELLWVVPLSSAECKLKLKRGTDAILDLFDQHQHSFVFHPGRKSYV